MKSYLMTGIAALTLCAGFTSCSHDDFEVYTQAQIDKAKYDQAFLNYVGGQIAANQDWGFGTSTTKGLTRAIQPSVDFPSDADASKFLVDVPEEVEKLTEGSISGVSRWFDESWVKDINMYGTGTLYIKGDCDFSNRSFYVAGGSEVYLVKGATLTLSSGNAGNLQGGTKYYIAEGAKLIVDGELKLNGGNGYSGLHIYNHGIVKATKLSTNSGGVLYNVGTVNVDGKISVENTDDAIVNDGTMTADELYTAGSGKFQNNGNVTIDNLTLVNSNNNAWVNNGTYRTGYFVYNAGSDDVINNCRLIVDEDFDINLGDNPGNGNFKMDAGSSVVTKNFNGGNYSITYWRSDWNTNYTATYNGGPFYIYMGSNSVFKVTGTATMDATKADYGIYGPETGDYAVFQAGEIVAGKAGQGYEVTYGGNLAVVTESHFANGYSGTYPYIDIKGNAKIYEDGDMPEITIEETECNPGFTGVPTEEEVGGEGDDEDEEEGETDTETEGYDLRIIAEDLSADAADDFDFNDVVIDVKYGNPAVIEVKAAGGTLPLRICGNDAWEVHDLFDVDQDCMVNTGASAKGWKGQDGLTAAPLQLSFAVNSPEDAKAIKIEVKKNGDWQELTAEAGKPAAKIAVDTTFNWLGERVSIKEAYENFTDWVNGTFKSPKWWE